MTEEQLIKIALEAREKSYSPYSGYKVGAALLTAAGKVYTGCNIENASYTPTNCAERTAFLRQSVKGKEALKPLQLLVERETSLQIMHGHVVYADRS